MDNKRKVILFSTLACISAASSAPIAAMPGVKHVFIVLPLVLMGIFLFCARYFAGLNKNKK